MALLFIATVQVNAKSLYSVPSSSHGAAPHLSNISTSTASPPSITQQYVTKTSARCSTLSAPTSPRLPSKASVGPHHVPETWTQGPKSAAPGRPLHSRSTMSTCGLCGAGRRPLAAAAAAVLTIALPRPDQHPETVWSDPCTISGPVHATEGASEHYLGRLHWSQLPMTLSSAIVDHGQEGAQGAVHLSSYQDTRQEEKGGYGIRPSRCISRDWGAASSGACADRFPLFDGDVLVVSRCPLKSRAH